MRLTDNENWVEVSEATLSAESGTPPDQDILLNVSVNIHGYSANDQAWVARTEWAAFLEGLRRLESERRGEVVLRGVLPDELALKLYVYDRAGHCAVSGHIGWRPPTDEGDARASLSFTLRFDAGILRATLDEFSTYGRKN